MQEELEELKPCPFCGQEADTHNTYIPGINTFAWVIGCDGAYGSGCPGYAWKLSPIFFTEEQAIRAWNRRSE